MTERDVEQHLKIQVERKGGMAMKFESPGLVGVPDRLICLPGGRAAFAELKAPGKKPRPIQAYRIRQIRRLGFRAEVLDSKTAVDEFVESLIRP